jgi:hypothetical protein
MAPSVIGSSSVKSAVSLCSIGTDWKTLYRAAILESDKSVVRQKVLGAESAVLLHVRDLFYNDGTIDEKEALADAAYVLGAYTNAFECADMDTPARPQQPPDP